MTEESSAGIPAQFKDMMTENEKRIKAIRDQIANQWDDQRKTIADLIEAQQNAVADFLAQQRSAKIADQWEAPAQGDRRSGRAAVERSTESDHGAGGKAVGRPKEGYRGRAECNRRDVPG